MQAKTLAWLDAMAPGLVASAMATANRVLPGAAGAKGNEEHAGHESRPRWMPSLVTRLADRAAERNNELRPRAPAPG